MTENITLDGVIDATEGWFSPEADEDTTDIEATLREQMQQEEGLLFGRRTFEDMRGYWPQQTDDTTGITDHLNRVPKYVMSSSIGVVHDLIGAGLVDEYRLFVYPVVLGQGERLFADATDVPELQLLEAKPYRSGIVLMRYSTA